MFARGFARPSGLRLRSIFHLGLTCAVLLSAAFFTSPNASAQFLYGALTGNVTDPTGAPLPGAKVEATNVDTNVATDTVTNEAGIYTISTLQPGNYKVTISAPSFSTLNQTGIVINVNQETRSNAQLKVAGVVETVTVSAGAEALQTDRGDVHDQISTKELTDLPIIGSAGRNFEALLKLVPGVQPPSEQNSAAGNPERSMAFNVNGISWVNNNVRLDGASVIYAWLPYLASYIPPAEDIQEVNIQTNAMLPEVGTAGGSFVNAVIRSGTNAFHGAAWEYNLNTDMNARPFFTYTPVARNIVNLLGARMGGPIKHNKLFFFGGWERTLQRQAINGLIAIPPTAERDGDFAGVSYKGSPVIIYNPYSGNASGTGRTPFPGNMIPAQYLSQPALDYLKLLPTENDLAVFNPGGTGTFSDYTGAGAYALTRDNADGKLTYNPDENSQLFGRYSISKETIADPYQLGQADGGTWDGGQPGAGLTTVQSVSLGGTHTFSPTMLMDGVIGFTHQRLGAQAPDVNTPWTNSAGQLEIPGTNTGALEGGIPYFNVASWNAMGNSNSGSPFLFRDNTYVGNLNFSKVKGTHQLRFGWDYMHFAMNHFQPQGTVSSATARGTFAFNGDMSVLNGGAAPNPWNSLADFELGLTDASYKVTQYIDPNSLRFSDWAFYAQDQWQVSPKLTVSYGLRYEFYPFLTRDNYGNFTYVPSTNDVLIGCEGETPCNTGEKVGWGFIAPRLGIAYRLNNKTVIRAGGGLSEDPDNYRDMRNTYPAYFTQQYVANSFQAAGSLAPLAGTLPQGTTNTYAGVGIPALVGPNLALGVLPLPNNIGTTAIANPYRRGYIESYNVTAERDLGAGFTWNVGYVGTHEVRQESAVNINAGPAGGGNAGRLLFVQYGTVNGDLNEVLPFGNARYDSLQTQLTRRVGTAQVGVVYTYSRAMDMGDNSTYNGLTFAYPAYWSRDWAAAGYDRTHNLEIWTAYTLPFGKGQKYVQTGVGAWVLGGWQINNIFTAASGTPFTVTTASNTSNAPGNTVTAEEVAAVQFPGNVGPGQQWFTVGTTANPVFKIPATNTLGNTGRNYLRGPGYFELDSAVFRTFPIKENLGLTFKAQAFAVTNTPIFGNPNASVGGSSFGQITSLAVSANGVTDGGGYRILQLALKLEF
jgi:hypothetical protein